MRTLAAGIGPRIAPKDYHVCNHGSQNHRLEGYLACLTPAGRFTPYYIVLCQSDVDLPKTSAFNALSYRRTTDNVCDGCPVQSLFINFVGRALSLTPFSELTVIR